MDCTTVADWLLVTSLSGLGHLCLTHLPSASPVCEMLSTPTGLRARASWAQLHTPVHTLPPNSLFVGSQSELVSPVKTLRAGLTGVTEAQVVTTGTAET